jgi:hypothetical protein
MELGVFHLLVDGDVEVGHTDRKRALDVGNLVHLGNGHERAAKIEPPCAVGDVGNPICPRLRHPVRAIEDGHHVPALFFGGRNTRRRT